jgi:hypothetical protein
MNENTCFFCLIINERLELMINPTAVPLPVSFGDFVFKCKLYYCFEILWFASCIRNCPIPEKYFSLRFADKVLFDCKRAQTEF